VALAVLARNAREMTLVEVHRELHLNGYAIASRQPVKRLADALGYEVMKGRAVRVERGDLTALLYLQGYSCEEFVTG